MRISIFGDIDIVWPKGHRCPDPEILPDWSPFRVCEVRSPCMERYFLMTPIPPVDVPINDTLETLVLHAIYVEFKPGDALITEMCDGGGRMWIDLFLDWDLVLSSSGTVFGSGTTKLVNPKLFETHLREQLSDYGNTGAWELYREYAEAVYADTVFDSIPANKKERLTVWQTYIRDYQKRFPGKRVA